MVALQHARQQGVPHVRASNHSVNAPMIAVNDKLGYVPYDGIWTLRKSPT
jgi:RimJ/RimL family protein N-acetyltransferase